MMTQPLNRFLATSLRHQYAHHLVAGRISPCAKNAASAVSRFSGKGILTADLVELGTPPDEFLNPIRPFLYQHPHRLFSAETVTGF